MTEEDGRAASDRRIDFLVSDATGEPYAVLLPKLSDYFEVDHIRRLTELLEDAEDPHEYGALLAAGVAVHCTKLSDSLVAAASMSMIDGLYKGMNVYEVGRVSVPILEPLAMYLRATARSLLGILNDRGYQLEYAVENSFPSGYGGPVYYYGEWFRAAGFVYVSPFLSATHLMEADGHTFVEFDELWPAYQEEARNVASEMYDRVYRDAAGWVVIDEDVAQAPLKTARSRVPRPGLVHVFRNAPPVAGTQIEMSLPDTLRDDGETVFATPPRPPQGQST